MMIRTSLQFGLAFSLCAPILGQTQLSDSSLQGIFELVPCGDGVLLSGTSLAEGGEPWFSDGTPAGTFPLDVNPGPGSSLQAYPEFTEYRGRCYFIGFREDTGRELYATDGTLAGTEIVKDFIPGPDSGATGNSRLVVFKDRLYLGAYDPGGVFRTWVSDGTDAGTTILADPGPEQPSAWHVAGDTLYFAAAQDGQGIELWKTDGSAAGTMQIADIEPGPGHSQPRDLYFYQGRLYFSAVTSGMGREPWVSDGTAAGTTLISEIAVGILPSNPSSFLGRGDDVYFKANLASGPPILWRTDGTAAGTESLFFGDEVAGVLVPVGDDVLMLGESITSGATRLARYSPATEQLETVLPMSLASDGNFTRVGSNEVYAFTGDEHFSLPNTGREVWVTDGTADGTGLLYDLIPGHEESIPTLFAPSGDQVFIATWEDLGVAKLWAGPALDFGAWLSAPLGAGCEGTGGLIPQLTSSGEATLNSPWSLELQDAAPSAAALLLLSVGTGYIDLGADCALYVDPTALAVPIATDAAGAFQLPATFTAAQLGLHLSLQIAISDAGGPGGALTVSNALEVLVGAG